MFEYFQSGKNLCFKPWIAGLVGPEIVHFYPHFPWLLGGGG